MIQDKLRCYRKNILVLQDDVFFIKNFYKEFNKKKQYIPQDWKLIYFGCSQHNWSSIKSTYGVNKIVMFSEEFPSIPSQIIKRIKDKLDKSGVYKEDISYEDYQQGDKVSIKEGNFAGLDAIFLSKKSNDRVRLLLKLLNSSIIAELRKSDIGNKKIVRNFRF